MVLLEEFFDDFVELVRLLLRQLLVETEQASLKVEQVVQVEIQGRLKEVLDEQDEALVQGHLTLVHREGNFL